MTRSAYGNAYLLLLFIHFNALQIYITSYVHVGVLRSHKTKFIGQI